MLAIGGMLWSVSLSAKFAFLYKISFYLAAIGAFFMVVAAFCNNAYPLKNNYIPMLQNFPFVFGLALFTSAILMQIILYLLNPGSHFKNAIAFGKFSAALITLIAFISFYIAALITKQIEDIGRLAFYENIFWGGGHVLQFTYTTLMLVVWLLLFYSVLQNQNILNEKIMKSLFILNILLAAPAPLFYYVEGSIEGAAWLFTEQMKKTGGIVPGIFALAIVFSCLCNLGKLKQHALNASFLLLSIFMFCYGGIIGFLISGSNAIIPAHYHGSIVGITLAFMGLIFYKLPHYGYGKVSGNLVLAQPYIYAIGQFLHITGLALMGGYGALRKAPGSSAGIDSILSKLMFFSGGTLAICGGLLFVIIALKSIICKNST